MRNIKKGKTLICALLWAVLCGALAGCSLAKTPDPAAQTDGHRLIGVYITRETPVEAMEGVLTQADAQAGAQAATEERVLSFSGLTGWALCVPRTEHAEGPVYTTKTDNVFTDLALEVHQSDNGNSVTISATSTLLPAADGNIVAVNPVYQRPDGSIYLLPGPCHGLGGDAALDFGGDLTVKQEQTVTADDGIRYTDTVILKLVLSRAPEEIAVSQMDEGGQLISRQTYVPGQVPAELTAEKNAAYLVVETRFAGGRAERRMVERQEGESYFTTLFDGGDGALHTSGTTVCWD